MMKTDVKLQVGDRVIFVYRSERDHEYTSLRYGTIRGLYGFTKGDELMIHDVLIRTDDGEYRVNVDCVGKDIIELCSKWDIPNEFIV